MAKLYQKPQVGVEVVMALNESEARALDALFSYGDDAFIDAFYKVMGRHYLEPHERGLRSLMKSVRSIVPNILKRVDRARDAFDPAPTLAPMADQDATDQEGAS